MMIHVKLYLMTVLRQVQSITGFFKPVLEARFVGEHKAIFVIGGLVTLVLKWFFWSNLIFERFLITRLIFWISRDICGSKRMRFRYFVNKFFVNKLIFHFRFFSFENRIIQLFE